MNYFLKCEVDFKNTLKNTKHLTKTILGPDRIVFARITPLGNTHYAPRKKKVGHATDIIWKTHRICRIGPKILSGN